MKVEWKLNGRRVSGNQIGRELQKSIQKQVDRATNVAAQDALRKVRRTPGGSRARLVRRGGKLYIES